MKKLSKTIYILRNLSFLTQKDMAKKMNISVSYYCELESEKKEISIKNLEKLSKIFSCSMSNILMISEKIDSVNITDALILLFKEL